MITLKDLSTMIAPGELVVTAVSGGMDSMALVHLLAGAREELGFKLHVAHVNHHLRGQEAQEDAEFVRAAANRLNLSCTTLSVHPAKTGGMSLQDTARHLRYQALVRLCEELGACKLALAHHQGDQAETLLLNLMRGSGPRGLRGMLPMRQLQPGLTLFRPLLEVSRDVIIGYCHSHGLTWREDSSNTKDYYRRNHIRLNLLPLLREYNPQVEKALAQTAAILQEELELLDLLSAERIEGAITSSPLPFAPKALSIYQLGAMPLALQRRAVLALAPANTLETRHVELVLALQRAPTGAEQDLPQGFKAYRLPDRLALGGSFHEPPPVKAPLQLPGRAEFLGREVVLTSEATPGSQELWLPTACQLYLANRQAGDKFRLAGGTKKLKSILIDRKVPRWLRGSLAVLKNGDHLVWVEGIGTSFDYNKPLPGWQQAYIKIT
jgi:tRNA(Ile)-lysidine synthase